VEESHSVADELKQNWTKTAHNTHTHFDLVLICTHLHATVWLQVEHWAYWRPQLVVVS